MASERITSVTMPDLEKETERMRDYIGCVYDIWSESSDYAAASSLENGTYEKYDDEIRKIIGEEACHSISDSLLHLACETEYAGFEAGFRYGVLFMSDMLKGGGGK